MASTELHARSNGVEQLAALDGEAIAMLEALVVQSGWNQTAEDWDLFFREGSVFVVREPDGRIGASGAVLPMGATTAWISMILVAPALRGRGLGRSVFEHCFREVERQGRVAMLDATPAGERLYVHHGFEPLWRLSRWHRATHASAASIDELQQADTGFERLSRLDGSALGLDRSAVLAHLSGRAGSRILGHASASAIVRAGRVARHIGPLLASDESAAVDLLEEAANHTAEPLLIDVPDACLQMQDRLQALGFERQRGFVRMFRGTSVPESRADLLHAIAGPEYG
ncbi:Acetyltransferase (GNAT) family protein [Burkholderiales bacterium 8X]|nr:Acetyltransferase (GNAT) family protein [Burkholderiales bacterium 8X]